MLHTPNGTMLFQTGATPDSNAGARRSAGRTAPPLRRYAAHTSIIAVFQTVSGSLPAETDVNEIFAPLRMYTTLITMLVLVAIGAGGLTILLLRCGRQRITNAVHLTAIAIEKAQDERHLTRQLAELRRWHSVTLNRETRVLELKREVNELLNRLGETPRYTVTLTEPKP